ncbi:MAG: hypothetical protein WB778_03055 [Thermoplasmata archaeon]
MSLFLLSYIGTAVETSHGILPADVGPKTSASVRVDPTGTSGSDIPRVVAKCFAPDNPIADAYDVADQYVYVADVGNAISIVKAPCTVIKTVSTGEYGTLTDSAYDPESREVFVSGFPDTLYTLKGTNVIGKITSAKLLSYPVDMEWDATAGAMLVADSGADEIAVVHGLSTHLMTTFATPAEPYDLLVADHYVFSASNDAGTVAVFNASTFAFYGTFNLLPGIAELAWDPVNDTVVVANYDGSTVDILYPQDIPAGEFLFSDFKMGTLLGGGGVAYSPSTHDIYVTGGDISSTGLWVLSPSGAVHFVYLGKNVAAMYLVYDPADRDMYVCGYANDELYVLQ